MEPKTYEQIQEMSEIPFKSLVGQLLYICITTRPDITTAVSEVAKFAQNPGQEHWLAALKIAKYLKQTEDYPWAPKSLV